MNQQEPVLRALDFALARQWDAAKAVLEPLDGDVAGRLFLLVCQLEQQDDARLRATAVIRHEIGNALAIAQSNLEGMVDGVLEPTPERIGAIVSSLASAGALLEKFRRSATL